jgi:FkbM family methyltransferase
MAPMRARLVAPHPVTWYLQSVLRPLWRRLVLSKLAHIRWLRRLTLKILRVIAPSRIRIRHHWTGDSFTLDPYRHKGYWWYGASREEATIRALQTLLHKGDSCVEVGGHIGYITAILAKVVGPRGRVVVYEPGPNNLPFLTENVRRWSNVRIRPVAVGPACEKRILYVENVTGQNNSLVQDYSIFIGNARSANVAAKVEECAIDVVSLDTEGDVVQRPVTLIKIDAEGFEREILEGARSLLISDLPMLMVEITSNRAAVFTLLEELGYVAFGETGEPSFAEEKPVNFNHFFLHPERHQAALGSLGWFPHRVSRSAD